MGYYVDLSSISIEDYKNKIKVAYLPPSRKVLRENPDERFACFNKMGVKNVKELQQLLKKKDKFAELANESCFNQEYLTILLRELNSLLPKPNKIKEFPGIGEEISAKLEKAGIKDTAALFEKVKDETDRNKLANDTGIADEDIMMLAKLTDLSRIKWVGVTFARMLYDLGTDSVEKAAKADPVELHKQINQLSKEQSIYKGSIGLNDIRIFVDAAKDVPVEIKF
jgi:hypothetical protein